MDNLEAEMMMEELECLKEKKEMFRSASLLMKTITAVIVFSGVLAIIGILVSAFLIDNLAF